jgi:hypothetical protein
MLRRVVAIIEVDDDIAIAENSGTLDYLLKKMVRMQRSGIELVEAKILDEDDPEDAEAISLTDKIFN